MWHYLFLTLRRQYGRSLLAASGFFITACAVILLSATTLTTALQANRIISQNWRPSYDLVVLPPQAKIPANNIVPADLLEGYDGGISLQQYDQIQQIPGVDIAAPIAFVGYVSLPQPLVQFVTRPLAAGYYRIDWTLSSFNGLKNIIEKQEVSIYHYLPSCDGVTFPGMSGKMTSGSFTNETQNNVSYLTLCGAGAQAFQTPDTGTFLMAAIDPAPENNLVHLDHSILSGRMLKSSDTIYPDPINDSMMGAPNSRIPVLVHQQLPGQLTLKATFTKIAPNTLTGKQIAARGGLKYLEFLPVLQTLFEGDVPLAQNDPRLFQGTEPIVLDLSDPNHFSQAQLVWDGHKWLTPWQNAPGHTVYRSYLSFVDAPSGLTYQLAKAPDGQSSPAYTLVAGKVQYPQAEVTFRNLRPLNIITKTNIMPYASAFYSTDPVGVFSGNNLDAEFGNLLNWLPENTYAPLPVIYRYDAQGRPVPPVNLLPTINPASFMLQAPLVLTTLRAAQKLKGNYCISAIRIRVAGVNAADQSSWQHALLVAQLIKQKTGLTVLVTLGSSPQKTLVYIPGVQKGQGGAQQTIGPLGWVEERWISIGAGIIYLKQLSNTQSLFLAAILLVCLGYLMVTFSTLVASQRREFAILSALGWRPWQPARLFITQALLLALCGGLAGIGMAILIIKWLGELPPWPIVEWMLPVILTLALLSILYPFWQIWRIRPAEVLRTGTTVSTRGFSRIATRVWSFLPAIGGMAWRNMARSRLRSFIAFGCIFASAALLTVMINGILALQQTLHGTFLGEYVLLQTALPQIAASVFVVVLTFFSVADLVLLQVRERRHEIGLLQAVGWRPAFVRRLFMQEGLTLAALGAIPGVLVALWILATLHDIHETTPTALVALGAVLLMLIVATLATLPAMRVANRMQLSHVLKAE